jgi:2-polyprenyl-6-methoxyphenol hydroxylase-like FAD-dependent oxidoreductase
VLTKDTVTAEYLDEDGAWKPAQIIFSPWERHVAGILTMTDGIHLDSSGHTVVRLRLAIKADGAFSLVAQLSGYSTHAVFGYSDRLPLTITKADAPTQP